MEKIIDLFPGFSNSRISSALLLHTKGASFDHISDYFTDGINETISQKAGYDKIITAHAILIISHILRSASEGDGSHFEPEKPTMINSLIEHIEGHLDERLNLDEVSDFDLTEVAVIVERDDGDTGEIVDLNDLTLTPLETTADHLNSSVFANSHLLNLQIFIY
jgi:hypothetical protein